jgi:hypothetical protein
VSVRNIAGNFMETPVTLSVANKQSSKNAVINIIDWVSLQKSEIETMKKYLYRVPVSFQMFRVFLFLDQNRLFSDPPPGPWGPGENHLTPWQGVYQVDQVYQV